MSQGPPDFEERAARRRQYEEPSMRDRLRGFVQVELVRDEDYLDAHNRGPYRWLLDLCVGRLHIIVGRAS